MHPKRITKADKNMVHDLDYKDIEFPVPGKDLGTIEKTNNVFINVFCYENELIYPVHMSDQKYEDCMDLLLITDEKSHIMSTSKISTDLCLTRQGIKINTFANIVYNILVVKEFWQNIK